MDSQPFSRCVYPGVISHHFLHIHRLLNSPPRRCSKEHPKISPKVLVDLRTFGHKQSQQGVQQRPGSANVTWKRFFVLFLYLHLIPLLNLANSRAKSQRQSIAMINSLFKILTSVPAYFELAAPLS